MTWHKYSLKRIICLLLCAVSLLLLTACGALDVLKTLKPAGTEQNVEKVSEIPAAEPEAVISAEQEAEIVEAQEESVEAAETPEAKEETEGILTKLKNSLPPPPDVDITEPQYLLANSYNSVGFLYTPPYGGLEGQGINAEFADEIMAFVAGARAAGYNCYVSVAYRNYEYLVTRYEESLKEDNWDAAYTASRRLAAGVNEHQTGLCIDLTDDANYGSYYHDFEDPEMKDTDLYQWAVEHCAEYGMILRYPEGKEAFYGTPCEHPAHFRYVGVEAATYIMENNLCLEEFLLLYDNNDVMLPQEMRDQLY